MPDEKPLAAPSRGERRTQDQRRTATRAALLKAAAEVVVETGVRSATLAAVGERAGYSRGIVTHYFGSKQALFRALAESSQSGFVPGVGDMPPGLDRLIALIDGYIGSMGDGAVAGRAFLLLWVEAATSPELSAVFQERDDSFRADLRTDIAAGIAAGDVRAETDPDATAIAVLGQLRGIGMQQLLAPAALDSPRLSRVVADQWLRALRR
ncbi:TetR/AcrR family transcriptional regulator [Streptomyces tsukubensis]|uniref:TetR family transcriptional regulator n=1 Tax=Streptomyces tsukubensis TaxID=83656 RepID=A0A1V4ACZ4_9ACTN|nr:TetR/AcrR family transcriptional regulator [Streptomyces tsukubensis]OON81095.1 TetR family transcriptional regulator [Streptomyces tsukubensis]QFR94931.1 TetR family transcriptional regulator [Streptomyces tsukubensis]